MDKIANTWLISLSIAAASTWSVVATAADNAPGISTIAVDLFSQPSEAHSRVGYSRAPGAALAVHTEAEEPMILDYVRSGPTATAADYAPDPAPEIGAAHELSLTTELSRELTPKQLAALRLYGAWLTDDGLSINAQQLIRAIQNASVHGLNPESYLLSPILHNVDTLTHMEKPPPYMDRSQHTAYLPDASRLRTDLSRQMDTAFVKLVTHLGQGVVDARNTQRELYRDVPQVHAQSLLDSVYLGQISVLHALHAVAPMHPDYQRLTRRMRNLLTERVTGIERPSVEDHGELSATMIHEDVMDVKFRLVEIGILPTNTVLTPFFDADLVVGLKKFQQQHGLPQSGSIDAKTRKALNTSIDVEIEALALSLERWRWMPRELGKKHLYINIPDYRVVFRDGLETKLSMIAVVGAIQHQTPSFSRDMTYMEFNPTWTVPSSIANKELIPKERRNPGYLASRQFEFLKRVDNQLIPVPAEQVSMADLKRSPFPYVLRQRGGPINALGKMKFLMPNPYSIYLHDTQAKNLFELNDRAFSHGCIRLSEPARLATLLMSEDGYDSSEIQETLQSTNALRVRLRSPIPTHLTYMTTWVDENGDLQRRADIYGHDPALKIALQASDTLLSILYRTAASLDTSIKLASDQ